MNIEFNQIRTKEDIEYVMGYFGGFHDACLKEIRYVSGSYVDEEFCMNPSDNIKQVYLIIQKQNKHHSVVEFRFDEIKILHVSPNPKEYDSIISGILLDIKDGYIYFADRPVDVSSLEKYSYKLTWIKAKSAYWREINKYIGESIIYTNRAI